VTACRLALNGHEVRVAGSCRLARGNRGTTGLHQSCAYCLLSRRIGRSGLTYSPVSMASRNCPVAATSGVRLGVRHCSLLGSVSSGQVGLGDGLVAVWAGSARADAAGEELAVRAAASGRPASRRDYQPIDTPRPRYSRRPATTRCRHARGQPHPRDSPPDGHANLGPGVPMTALHNRGCSRGLNPPLSRSDLAM